MLSNQIVGKPISHLRIYAEPLANTLISLIICACLKKLNGIPQEKIKEYFGLSNKKCPKYPYSIMISQVNRNHWPSCVFLSSAEKIFIIGLTMSHEVHTYHYRFYFVLICLALKNITRPANASNENTTIIKISITL